MSKIPMVMTVESKKKKRKKQPTQHDPRGIPVMVMGPTGKTRMVWSSEYMQGLRSRQ